MLTSEESSYYGRQLILAEFGQEAQLKLKNSRVFVAGAGGLGCPALLYLVGAGVGNIIIADADVVQLNNLHRQVLYSIHDIGKKKVEAARQRLTELNPHIHITSVPTHITAENAGDMLKNVDVVIDATDNFETRIKFYELASKRMLDKLNEAGANEEFKSFSERLKAWTTLLSESLKDIEENLIADSKSRAMINYEIQVRKAIAAIENLKLKAPAEQQDAFESTISAAERVRKKFVEILFRH